MLPGLDYASPAIVTAPSSPTLEAPSLAYAPRRAAAEVRATVSGEASEGEGPSFRLRPRWPSADQLDYVNKAATAALLVLGLLILAGYALRNPAGAFSVLVRGAAARAGVR